MKLSGIALAAVFVVVASTANAQLVISSNDGHELEPGQGPEARSPDSISVIDFSRSAPRLLGSIVAPGSILGPPTDVAIARGGKFALVAGGTKVDPTDPSKNTPSDTLSVIDLRNPKDPLIVQSLHAGLGADGVAINRRGTLALVANTNAGSISIYSIRGGRLMPAGELQLGGNSRPATVIFLPDGKAALVAGGPSVLRLSIDGTRVAISGPLEPAIRGTVVTVTPDGRFALINGSPADAVPGQGTPSPGRGGSSMPRAPQRPSQVSLVDLLSGTVIAKGNLDGSAEFIGLSSDGRYLEATVTNGSHDAPTSAGFHDFGLIQIFRVSDTAITPITDARTGHWCQGAVWSKDNHTLLLGCGVEKEIEVFRFDGTTLTQDAAATIKLGAASAALGQQPSR